jgi:hypothetical protein
MYVDIAIKQLNEKQLKGGGRRKAVFHSSSLSFCSFG